MPDNAHVADLRVKYRQQTLYVQARAAMNVWEEVRPLGLPTAAEERMGLKDT